MKITKCLSTFFIVNILASFATFAATPIRVVCVGNSITEGVGASDAAHNYPSQLAKLLGASYSVLNCGVSGRTMLKKGDFPYWNESKFASAKNFNPDIVIISLGTNDSKSFNWVYKKDFFTDYTAMVNAFRLNGKNPQIFVCSPPPAFIDNYSITDSVIRKQIIPLVDSLRVKMGTSKIDFYYPLFSSGTTFPDGIHPNDAGALLMAKIAYRALTRRITLGSVVSPNPKFSLTANEPVSIQINNNKDIPLTNVPIAYKIDGNTEVKEMIPLVPAQSTVRFQFTQKADLSQIREYSISIYSAVDSLMNDTVNVKVKNVQPFTDFAPSFTGGNLKVSIPNSTSLNSSKAFTVEAWIYPTAFRANIWDGSVISKESSNAYGFALNVGGNGQARLVVGTGSSWLEAAAPVKSIVLNKWTHIAGVYSGTNIKLYVDGVLKSTVTTSAYKVSSTPMLIGASSAFGGREFIGGVDEVRVWNKALTITEISDLKNYKLNGDESGLVSYYNFDDSYNSSILKDLKANANKGSIQVWDLGFNWMQGATLAEMPVSAIPHVSSSSDVTFYPNPATDLINVSLKKKNADASLELTDLLGKTVLRQNFLQARELKINVRNVPRGMYLLTLKMGSERTTSRIILK